MVYFRSTSFNKYYFNIHLEGQYFRDPYSTACILSNLQNLIIVTGVQSQMFAKQDHTTSASSPMEGSGHA